MKIKHLTLVAVATLALAGCSSQAAEPQVASVPSASTSTSTSTSTTAASTSETGKAPKDQTNEGDVAGPGTDDSGPTDGRPQFRLDDTPQRRTALQVAYNQCLLDNGAQENTGREGAAMAAAPGEDGNGNPVGPLVLEPVPAEASAACLSKLPVMPPELEASTNPDFHAQSLAYVACMQKGGLYVELLNHDNLDWTYADGHPVPDDSYQLEDDCLLEAFSK
jgi:outer membrane murein-binding lipoprotein Lpp